MVNLSRFAVAHSTRFTRSGQAKNEPAGEILSEQSEPNDLFLSRFAGPRNFGNDPILAVLYPSLPSPFYPIPPHPYPRSPHSHEVNPRLRQIEVSHGRIAVLTIQRTTFTQANGHNPTAAL